MYYLYMNCTEPILCFVVKKLLWKYSTRHLLYWSCTFLWKMFELISSEIYEMQFRMDHLFTFYSSQIFSDHLLMFVFVKLLHYYEWITSRGWAVPSSDQFHFVWNCLMYGIHQPIETNIVFLLNYIKEIKNKPN